MSLSELVLGKKNYGATITGLAGEGEILIQEQY